MVRKVFGAGSNKEERIKAALKKFFFPINREFVVEHNVRRPQENPPAGDAKHPGYYPRGQG